MSQVPAQSYSNERVGLGAAGLALLSSFLWGGTQPFIKLGLDGLPPLAMAAARFSIGWLIIVAAVRLRRVPLKILPGEWRGLLCLSGIFFLQIALLNEGTDRTTAGSSTILIAAHPFFVALLCHFFVPGDRLSLAKVAGMALAFSGVLLMFAESVGGNPGATAPAASGVTAPHEATLAGDVLVLGSAMLLGMRLVVLKRLVRGLDPFKLLFWQSLLALPVFAISSALFERDAVFDLTPMVIGAVLYQGVVVAGFCFIVWIHLLRRHSASRLGVFSFSTPILGVVLSVLLVGEPLTGQLLASVALVGGGIVLVNGRS